MVEKQKLGAWFMIIGSLPLLLTLFYILLFTNFNYSLFNVLFFLVLVLPLFVTLISGIKLRNATTPKIRKWLWISLLIGVIFVILMILSVIQNSGSVILSVIFLIVLALIIVGSIWGLRSKTYEKVKSTVKKDTLAKARNLMIIGGAILFVISLIVGIASYYLFLGIFYGVTYVNQIPPIITSFFADFMTNVVIYEIVNVVLFVVLVIAALRIRSTDAQRALKWKKIAFVMAFAYPLALLWIAQALFENSVFFLPLLLNVSSNISTLGKLLSSSWFGALPILYIADILLSFIVFIPMLLCVIGAVYGLGREQKSYMARTIVVISVIIIIAVFASYYMVNNSNNAAINDTNGKIIYYGGNVRYLLANGTALGQILGNASTYPGSSGALFGRPFRNVSDFVSLLSSYGSSAVRLGNLTGTSYYFDWGTYNPLVRGTTIGALYYLGAIYYVPVGERRISNLKSFYELSLSGTDILLIATELGKLFSCSGFSAYNYNLTYTSNQIGVEIVGTYGEGSVVGTTLTTRKYPDDIAALPDEWLGLMTNINVPFNQALSKGYFVCKDIKNKTTSMSLGNFFYLLTLGQDYGDFYSQVYLNETVRPYINSAYYLGNRLIVNLGNLNLSTTQQISLYADGKSLAYKRYYSYLLANVSMSNGQHYVNVSIGNSSDFTKLFVSPYLSINQFASRSGKLYVTLANPFNQTMSISNFGITSMNGPFFISPNVTGFIAATKFSFAKNQTVNVTTYSNITSFNLIKNQSIRFNYTIGHCQIGQNYAYATYFNTSKGPAFYILYGKCS